jgi:hypothetical protein
MKRAWLIALLASSSRAADVTVFMTMSGLVPNQASYGAKIQVTRMLAQVGVSVDWRNGEPSARSLSASSLAIRAGFIAGIPEHLHKGALAYAQPFDPIPVITVMYDRLQGAVQTRPSLERTLLAHVLAHEIGHILQRTAVHAETGIMKAQWTEADYNQMAKRPMLFTPTDEEMIRIWVNLERRRDQNEKRVFGACEKRPTLAFQD